MAVKALKRKTATSSTKPPSSKKPKTDGKHLSTANNLPWKTVLHPQESGVDIDEGILELEEVDDVEVIYEETEVGRVVRFKVLDSSADANEGQAEHIESIDDGNDDEHDTVDVEEVPAPSSASASRTVPPPKARTVVTFDSKKLLPEWHTLSLHPQLFLALHGQSFTKPTPIQAQTIPTALAGRDIVGVAETGSGKTLAYGLPILHELLTHASPIPATTRRPLRALILAPTRELALQVSTHLNACLNSYTEVKTEAEAEPSLSSKGKGKKAKGAGKMPAGGNAPPLVSIAAIVGGMSAQKQRRVLERGVDVLVATPGRLWDILEEDDHLAKDIKGLRYLVLDEADRMIETGHFAELDNILRLTHRSFQKDTTDDDFAQTSLTKIAESEVETRPMQTFVFSATLSKDLQRNLKKRFKPRLFKTKNPPPASTLDDLILRLDFRDPEPEVVDISPEGGIVSTLQESKIECLTSDKDAYLYYFLTRYPGRTLVFLSSIDGIRRLTPLLELLGLPIFPLHSQLEQRQRLKNLDRFKTNPNAILLATDIAARGLDVTGVAHVVHYQIPRSADAYVHRNGRTARAQHSGFSMLMCAPDERRLVRAFLAGLGRQDSDIPEVPIEHHFIDKLKQRLALAKQIDNAQHRATKATHDRNWIRSAAEAMDIELESDGEEEGPSNRTIKARQAKTAVLKAELTALLRQPLVARGVSTRYITSGSRPIVDDILAGEDHRGMVGVKKSQAGSDLVHAKKAAKSKKGKITEQTTDDASKEEEEWTGFGS